MIKHAAFVDSDMLAPLGIIAGGGDLPYELATLYSQKGGRCYIAALEKECILDQVTLEGIYLRKFSLGSVGAIIKYFSESKVENVIIIGGVTRPDLRSLKVDIEGSALIAKILKKKFLGDDNVLRTISTYIESKGFKVISPRDILPLNDYDKLITSKNAPSKLDTKDIELGLKVLVSLGNVDVGQSIIVCDGYVLGIEAAEGTDSLIQRCAGLRKKQKGGVLVKIAKSSQDVRLDIPVIGPQTISLLAEGSFHGAAIEKGGVIIINPLETNRLLNENKLFLNLI